MKNLDIHPLLRYFEYDHLPPKLQKISKEFFYLANRIDSGLPKSAETTVALRKLLEAKDAAVRSALDINYPEVTDE